MVTLLDINIQGTIHESAYPVVHQATKQFQISQKLYRRTVEIAVLLAAFNRVIGRDKNDEIWQPE